VFAHNDLNRLEHILQWAVRRPAAAAPATPAAKRRILIATESLFSMDGDTAPLRHTVELKEKYGAWLLLDEAHASGIFGHRRRGLAEAHGVADRVEVQMGTLGKALGCAGGYICGSRGLIDYLVNRARTFLFSTAPVPAQAAAARAAVELIQSAEGEARTAALWTRIDQARQALATAGFDLPAARSAILPLRIGDEKRAVAMSEALRDRGVFVPAIRYPTVARGAARLRLTLSAAHTTDHLAQLAAALKSASGPGAPLSHASAGET
jgi:7-keto-8-aminopelargonate synthetase-like enzyme